MSVLWLRGGRIYDGTGSAPQNGDVWIRDERIVAVGEDARLNPDVTVDAGGRVLCPAFVDIHRHPDAKPFGRWTGEAELRQGIGTAVCGNCGMSLAPAGENRREQYAFQEPVLGAVPQDVPKDFPGFLAALQERNLPVNLGALIGTGSLRTALKGFSPAPFTEDEFALAQKIMQEALKDGALGASMGIMYLPECYGSREEFARLLKPVGQAGRPVFVHIRGEGDTLLESVEEVLEIACRASCALEISHFKSCGPKNWRREIHRAITLINSARADGQDVSCDFYPYDGGSTALTTMLPPSFLRGTLTDTLKYLGTPEGVKAYEEAASKPYDDWENFVLTLSWERIIVSGVVREENKRFLGLSVAEGARRYGFAGGSALAAHLMHTDEGKTAIINLSMCQDDMDAIARLPYSNIISDAIYADTETPHPRMFGAFPRALRIFAVERTILPYEEVIAKMTSRPARRVGLHNRGVLRPGAYADVLMFDKTAFTDHATYENSAQLSTGLDLMLLNGKITVQNDRVQHRDAGRVIFQSGREEEG